MDFISNKEPQNQEMLEAIGIKYVEELFAAIPESLRVAKPEHNDGFSEFEGMQLMESIAKRNDFSDYESYLGAGAYEHHVPALIASITSRAEFLTSYTPYQAEASQGLLQLIFEYQSCICALTGLDASNASLYDGASACAEAVLMALRHHKKRNKVLLPETLHPHYRAVVDQYLASHHTEIIVIPADQDGLLDLDFLKKNLDEEVATLLLQSPNFLGVLDSVEEAFSLCKEKKILTILSGNPLSYGLFATPHELQADIAVGDCQPLGVPLQFGGPYAGYIACKEFLLRQMPGRIVGETVDTEGKRGYVLTLQAREQHIRRDKATSNICTNQSLIALTALITMLWYGKEGMAKLALTNFQRASYLKDQLSRLPGITISSKAIHFNEFALQFSQPLEGVIRHFHSRGIDPGFRLDEQLLVAVTETKSLEQLDRYVEITKEIASGRHE